MLRVLGSYKVEKFPEEDFFRKKLSSLPDKYLSLCSHAFLTRDVSVEIARELQANGVQLNPKMLEVAHLARAWAKPFSDKLEPTEGKTTRDLSIRAVSKYLGKTSKPLAELVSKYYSLDKPSVLSALKAEDVPFLAAGYIVRGKKSGESFSHSVVLPEEALEILLKEQPGNETFLREEFKHGIKPLFEWLDSKNVDLKQIVLRANEKIKVGVYK